MIGHCEYCTTASQCVYCKGEQRDMRQTREQGSGKRVLICSAWPCQKRTVDVLPVKPEVKRKRAA